MTDCLMLGIKGDLNLIKRKLNSSYDNILPYSVVKYDENDEVSYIYFDFKAKEIYKKYVNILAEYIIERYEQGIVKRIISVEYDYLNIVQQREVMKNIDKYSDDPELGYKIRKKAIAESIDEYIKSDNTMLLEGFVSFRLKEYEGILSDIIERLIEDYITEKEYNDFIGLLKYFVNIQDHRPEITNVLVTVESKYIIIDEKGRDITEKCLLEFIDEDEFNGGVNLDDLLISILITLAPQKIMVHNYENVKNKELFRTIDRVFDKNVFHCHGCKLCLETAEIEGH